MPLPRDTTASDELLASLRALQRRNRFIVSAGDAPFTLTESHLIAEISIAPGINPAQLAAKLMLQRSTALRAIRNLTKRKLVTTTREHGRRDIGISLSERGAAILADADPGASARMAAMTAGMTDAEQQQLGSFIERLGTALGAEVSRQRPGEHILRAPIRCLTRSSGILSDNMLRSGLSSSSWQILESVREQPEITTLELANHLALARSTVTLLLRRLTREGLILTRNHAEDARRTLFVLSKKGEKRLLTAQETAAAKITEALDSFTPSETRNFVELFARLTAERQPATPEAPLRFMVLTSPNEIRRARGFALRWLVAQGKEESAPESIATGFCAAAGQQKNIDALLELGESGNPGVWNIKFAIAGGEVAPAMLQALLQHGLQQFFAAHAGVSIAISRETGILDGRLLWGKKPQQQRLLLNRQNFTEFLQSLSRR